MILALSPSLKGLARKIFFLPEVFESILFPESNWHLVKQFAIKIVIVALFIFKGILMLCATAGNEKNYIFPYFLVI